MKTLGLAALAAVVMLAGQAKSDVVIYQSGFTLSGGPIGEAIAGDHTFSSPFPSAPVADSFTAPANSVVDAIDFRVSLQEGLINRMTSVDWTFTNGNPLDGGPFTVIASGVATLGSGNLLQISLGPNPVNSSETWYSDLVEIPGGVRLTGGNFWLELSGVTSTNVNAFWTEDSGPSIGWTTAGGEAPSGNNFELLGQAPEPATWTLMLAGFAGLGAALRSRRSRRAAWSVV